MFAALQFSPPSFASAVDLQKGLALEIMQWLAFSLSFLSAWGVSSIFIAQNSVVESAGQASLPCQGKLLSPRRGDQDHLLFLPHLFERPHRLQCAAKVELSGAASRRGGSECLGARQFSGVIIEEVVENSSGQAGVASYLLTCRPDRGFSSLSEQIMYDSINLLIVSNQRPLLCCFGDSRPWLPHGWATPTIIVATGNATVLLED